ncbi:MAG: ABC transporter ATP-binding protein [Deltaproteobacteria bacterium]|nr:ABC transporter ATP-binding protein [Deltaproteobacteria bacterium]
MSTALVELCDIAKAFAPRRGGGAPIRALCGVSLTIARGETLGLVGESGCGKSTLGRILLRLLVPDRGRVRFDGADITDWSPRQLRPLRRRMQVVFQDSVGALNPRLTVRAALLEPLTVHRLATGDAARRRLDELLRAVGLSPDRLDRYPHELSGGERQRVGIARALTLQPELIVADEPASALDVSVQAQVLNLLLDLAESRALAYLFISHDLAVVRYLSHRVAVMFAGRIVEVAPTAALFETPAHPYTQALLAAAPGPRAAALNVVVGATPAPTPGCSYRDRCPHAFDRCAAEEPALTATGAEAAVACHWSARPTPLRG